MSATPERPRGAIISAGSDASDRGIAHHTPRDVCYRCKRELTLHGFTTPDGHWIVTYHCREHGDVAPPRSLIVNEERAPCP